MNKITFDQMLHANGLPGIGEIVTTPNGDKVEVVGYTYIDIPLVIVEFEALQYTWGLDQVRLCTWEGKEDGT